MFSLLMRGRKKGFGFVLSAVAAGVLLMGAAPASAQTTLNFSSKSSDSTPASALNATATFTVVGNQLKIDINNTSAFRVVDLYFNTDASLLGLDYASGAPAGVTVSDAGSGIGQTQNTPFGNFNIRLSFDTASGPKGLAQGSSTSLLFDMLGTTSVSTIGTKLSSGAPPANGPALGVIKFQSGPGDDSAFGAATTGSTVPDGPSGLLLASGILPLLGVLRLRRRSS